MQIALCKCGVDMSVHPALWDDEEDTNADHEFDASGTKYRCEELILVNYTGPVGGTGDMYLCPRPAYHKDHGVPCGPINGKKLW